MKSSMVWLCSLLMISTLFWVALPSGWAKDHYDGDIFEIMIKDLDFKYEDTSLTDQTIVLPVGVLVSWMNVDPLITSSGLEGIMPHGVKIEDTNGKVVEQSKLLFQDNTIFEHEFSHAGVYSYQCIVHPFMKGKFLVFKVQEPNLVANQGTTE